MQPKTHRKCVTCGSEFRKFKTTDKFCSPQCAKIVSTRTKPRKKIAPISDSMVMKLKEYRLVRDEFMRLHPKCQICGKESTDLHHKNGRIGSNLTDVKTFMALCRKCHREVHDNPKLARGKGYLI